MKRAWASWVELWSGEESPTLLAAIRIAVGVVIAWDLWLASDLGVVTALWAPHAEGGMSLAAPDAIVAFRMFGATADTARALHAVALVSAIAFAAGALTRVAAVVCLFAYAQLAALLPEADRGVDVLLRHALVILALSGTGATWSVDARVRHGRFHRPDARVPSWPRRLLVLQLVWMYFSAATQKLQLAWSPLEATALYYILSDPHFARHDPAWLEHAFVLTQIGTVVTMLFEWTAPLVLVSHRSRWLRRVRFRAVWIATGVTFHLALALTMRLGIFPFGVLALYPALMRPDEAARIGRSVHASRAWCRGGARRGRTPQRRLR